MKSTITRIFYCATIILHFSIVALASIIHGYGDSLGIGSEMKAIAGGEIMSHGGPYNPMTYRNRPRNTWSNSAFENRFVNRPTGYRHTYEENTHPHAHSENSWHGMDSSDSSWRSAWEWIKESFFNLGYNDEHRNGYTHYGHDFQGGHGPTHLHK